MKSVSGKYSSEDSRDGRCTLRSRVTAIWRRPLKPEKMECREAGLGLLVSGCEDQAQDGTGGRSARVCAGQRV